MNKYYLQTQLKSTGTAYLFYFVLAAHYAYLNKWGLQVLYWVTLGGVGIWAIIDLFTMSKKVKNHNTVIFMKIEEIEKKEKEEEQNRSFNMMSTVFDKKSS